MLPAILGGAAAIAVAAVMAMTQTGDGTPAAKPATQAAATAISAEQFALKAATSDKFEIESSKLVLTTATTDNVKNFARMMINEHTASTGKLVAIAAATKPPITLRAETDPMQRKWLADIRTATGVGVDRTYLDAQIVAHSSTLATLKGYAAGGTEPKLVAFAKETIPTVSKHLDTAKELRAAS